MVSSFHPFDAGKERYGDDRHPDLPWGYWMVSSGAVPGEPPLIDENGREWRSVREAFWVGRLGMPSIHAAWANEIMEFMASYLAIIDGRFVAREERVQDVFLGDGHFEHKSTETNVEVGRWAWGCQFFHRLQCGLEARMARAPQAPCGYPATRHG